MRKPEGNCASYTAPSNMYASQEKVYFTVVASSNAIFARLAEAVGQAGWASDPRFDTNPHRVQNLAVLKKQVLGAQPGQDFGAYVRQMQKSLKLMRKLRIR